MDLYESALRSSAKKALASLKRSKTTPSIYTLNTCINLLFTYFNGQEPASLVTNWSKGTYNHVVKNRKPTGECLAACLIKYCRDYYEMFGYDQLEPASMYHFLNNYTLLDQSKDYDTDLTLEVIKEDQC